MIVDKIKRIHTYDGVLPEFAKAVDFALALADKENGRYDCEDFPAGTVFAIVQEGKGLTTFGNLEAHKKYIDVQILLDGGETVYYADLEDLKEAVPYDESKDVMFFEPAGQPAQIPEGSFYVAFPHDGHMPSRVLAGYDSYRKIVLKIKIA